MSRYKELYNKYYNTYDFSFSTGNLGISFSYIVLGSLSNDNVLYDQGLSILEETIRNIKKLNEIEFLFLNNMLLFLNNNKFIDFEDSFFDDSTDSYIAKRIEFCKIEVSDFKIFLFLYYVANRKEILYKDSGLQRTVTAILCELVILLENDSTGKEKLTVAELKFLFYCQQISVYLVHNRLVPKISNCLQSCLKNIILSFGGRNQDANTDIRESLYEGITRFYKSNQTPIGLSQSIKLCFLDSTYRRDRKASIARLSDIENTGLFNSNLGFLLADRLANSPNKDNPNFFIQF